MPTSDPANLWPALHVIASVKPASVLDVGVGFGKMGMLMREYLEVTQGRYQRAAWKIRIEGVEPFSAYRNPIWEACYDRIWEATLQEILPRLGHYDLATFLDVIEHLPKEEGTAALAQLAEKARFVLISTPVYFYAQQAAHGNELERHVSHWTERDFARYHHLSHRTPTCLMVLLSTNSFDKRAIRFPSALGKRYAEWRSNAAARGKAWAQRALPAPAAAALRRLWRTIVP